MEYCMNSKKNCIMRSVHLVLCIVMSGVFLFFGHSIPPATIREALLFLILKVFGVLVFAFGVFYHTIQSRKFEIRPDGICIYYWKRIQTVYAWNEISHISICRINQSTSGPKMCDLVIRLVRIVPDRIRGEGTHRSFEYDLFHFGDIINLEFSEDRLEKVCQFSEVAIEDLR